MEDIMHIQSAFLRGLISDAVRNAIRKRGYDGVNVDLNDISAGYSENEKKVHVHLDIDAEMSKKDLVDILRSIDILCRENFSMLYEMISLRIIFLEVEQL